MKDVSSKQLLHKESAISMNSKRTILTQQCLRVILNCSKHLEEQTKNDHLSFFMARMQASGYDHAFRLEVLKSAKNAHDEMKRMETEGKPIHRERTWKRKERRKEREQRRKNWYRTGKFESVLFIPATPNSELRNKMQKELNEKNAKIKVIERSGTKIVRLLQRNDPFKKKTCSDSAQCLVCSGEEAGGCRESGVGYKIKCKGGCNYDYNGQTSQNAYSRGGQHIDDYKNRKDDSPLWKHCVNVHNGELQTFEMSVVDRCRNDPTKRQILEAVRLQRASNETTMNSRSEWNTARVPRIQIRTDAM